MQQGKSAFEQLMQYRDQLAADLHRVENSIQDAEYAYFTAEHSQAGHVLKGFDGYLSSKEALRKRQARGFKVEDRLFSLSSKSSPLSKELGESEGLDGGAGGGFGKKGLRQGQLRAKGVRTEGQAVTDAGSLREQQQQQRERWQEGGRASCSCCVTLACCSCSRPLVAPLASPL